MRTPIEWVRRCPDPMPGEESEIEIRPIYALEDYTTVRHVMVNHDGEATVSSAEGEGSTFSVYLPKAGGD